MAKVHNGIGTDTLSTQSQGCFGERHLTVGQIAEAWQVSTKTVRKIFEREPGVLIFGAFESRVKRRYVTLRIPKSVYQRVYRRLGGSHV
jgi:hypothetical protein